MVDFILHYMEPDEVVIRRVPVPPALLIEPLIRFIGKDCEGLLPDTMQCCNIKGKGVSKDLLAAI